MIFHSIRVTNPRYTVGGDHRLTLRFDPPGYEHAPALRIGTERGGDDTEACWLTIAGVRELRETLDAFIAAAEQKG